MARMLNRNWKGGKHPCSCCCGGPIAMGRAAEKREWQRDEEANAGYLTLARGKVAQTVEVNDDLNIDLDADGRLLGIEVLHLRAVR